jgi:hypothetical protein
VSERVEVDSVPFPFGVTAESCEPVVWQDEHHAVVIFETDAATPEERGVLRFEGLLQSRFGYPNDEALAGHPYATSGIGFYGLFEVKGSGWLAELGRQNQVAFPNSPWPPRPFRHFVLTFHDSTFEALCMNVGGRATDETVAEIIGRLLNGERA